MMCAFLNVDVDGKHVPDMEDTFFDYFDIESSEYNKRAFRLLTTFGEKVTMMILVLRCCFVIHQSMRACLLYGQRTFFTG